VAVIDTKEFKVVARWKVEDHPNEMLMSKDGRRLFVANANRNSVSAIDVETGKISETLVATLPIGTVKDDPQQCRLGTHPTPSRSPRMENICSSRMPTSIPSRSSRWKRWERRAALAFIPVGWYPTSVRVAPDGKSLIVANGKGLISKA
jgi:YVTN family beta-propeller protein